MVSGIGTPWQKGLEVRCKSEDEIETNDQYATIPTSVPSGEYLLRVEHIALHSAAGLNGAQLYMSCA